MKQKKCRVCGSLFSPLRPLQRVCGASCALALVRTQAEEKERLESRKTIRLQKEKLKTRNDHIKETAQAVHAYVRYRDKDKPCISCGSPLHSKQVGGAFDAGHYRSRGSSPHLRFDADRNIHGQCKRCNRYLGGNYAAYRIGLIERIGIDKVIELESDNEPRKYTIEELKEIKARYKLKLKQLRDSNER